MTLHALEDVDDALAATRAFLASLDRTMWIKLAFVVFFIAGPGANFNSFQYSFGGEGNGTMPLGELFRPPFDAGFWFLIAVTIVVLLVIALAFALVGSVMEFVFLESLRTRQISVRRYWGEYWRQGLRLFGFRVLIGFFVFGSVALLSLPFFLLGSGSAAGGLSLAVFLLLFPAFIVLAIIAGLISGFTTVFVVPIMILEDCGVFDGWRRLWPTLTSQWIQYLAYVVTSFFLTIIGGIVIAIVAAVIAIVLLIPFGILFALGFGLLAFVFEPLGIGVLVFSGVLFAAAMIVVVALVQVPVQTYLRYYALLVLGDIDMAFDLIPDQRVAIRGTSTETPS